MWVVRLGDGLYVRSVNGADCCLVSTACSRGTAADIDAAWRTQRRHLRRRRPRRDDALEAQIPPKYGHYAGPHRELSSAAMSRETALRLDPLMKVTATMTRGSFNTRTLNNGVADARPRVRRLPDPAGGDHRRGRDRAARRLPAHRHRRRVRQRARGRRRRSAAPASTATTSSSRPRSGSATTATTQTLHAFDKSAGKLGVDQHRPAHPAPGAARRVRPDDRRLPGAGDAARRRQGARDRRQQLHARPPRPAARATTEVVPAVNQIELHPYFRQPDVQAADAEHGILTQAWSPIGGITFYRDGPSTQHARGPDASRDRRGARQDARAGDAALAPAAGPLGDPEVDQRPPASPRTSTSSTSSSPPTSWPRSTRSTPACAAARSRSSITLETFGRDIPEA